MGMVIWESIIIIIGLLASCISMGWDCSRSFLGELRTNTSKPSYQPSSSAWY